MQGDKGYLTIIIIDNEKKISFQQLGVELNLGHFCVYDEIWGDKVEFL